MMNRTLHLLKTCLLLYAVVSLSSCARTLSDRIPAANQKNNAAEGYVDVNADNPGEEVNVKSSVVYGKYTIVDFTSPGCGPCQEIKPYLQQLHDVRPDIVVRSFDINREGTKGIDWDSPLVKQYGLRSVPSFKIFNERGLLVAEGKDASQQVLSVLTEDVINKK